MLIRVLLRCIVVCSTFILEMFSEATPARELGSTNGQREKLKSDTVATESSADPQGVWSWHGPSELSQIEEKE